MASLSGAPGYVEIEGRIDPGGLYAKVHETLFCGFNHLWYFYPYYGVDKLFVYI
jgi:hypothetical protein